MAEPVLILLNITEIRHQILWRYKIQIGNRTIPQPRDQLCFNGMIFHVGKKLIEHILDTFIQQII